MKEIMRIATLLSVVVLLIIGCASSPQTTESQETPAPESGQASAGEAGERESESEEPVDPGVLIRVLDAPGGEPTSADLQVYKAETDEKVYQDYRQEQELDLENGSYDILASYRTGEVWKRGVQVDAAERQVVEVILNAGRLEISILDGPDGELTNGDLYVFDAESGEQVFHDYRQEERLLLPAGTYDVTAETGGAEVTVEGVAVAAGETTKQELILQ